MECMHTSTETETPTRDCNKTATWRFNLVGRITLCCDEHKPEFGQDFESLETDGS